MEQWFAGKAVFVTGGGGGIGRAASQLFALRGAKVTVADVNADSAQQSVRAIETAGGSALAVSGDVSQAGDVERMIAQSIAWAGGLNIAFNNAGIVHPRDSEWDIEAFEQTIDINLLGIMMCMKAQIRQMIAQGGGAIVNTSSAAGIVASALPAVPAYTSSKHAIIGLSKSAALQYAASGIRVNAVCPGVVATGMSSDVRARDVEAGRKSAAFPPLGRKATAEEVAEAVIWLASDKASFVTGSALLVDGGYTAQ